MNESRTDITARLRADGRWDDEAKGFLEDRRAFHQANGMAAQHANVAAWNDVRQKYPPIESASGQEFPPDQPTENNHQARDEFADEVRELAKRSRGQQPDAERDLDWAYMNLGDDDVRPSDAPSLAAWEVLMHGRTNKSKFLDSYLGRRNSRPHAAETDHLPKTPDGRDPATKRHEEMFKDFIAQRPPLNILPHIRCPHCERVIDLRSLPERYWLEDYDGGSDDFAVSSSCPPQAAPMHLPSAQVMRLP